VCGFPETEINLENTADLVEKSRKIEGKWRKP
jgi:hypothetical protein